MLEARSLSAGYDDARVLQDVTLVVPTGSVTVLLGANGAGKTTLLRALAGLLPAMSGRVVLDGTDVTTMAADVRSRRGVCLVPEGRGVFPTLTVKENLNLFARRSGSEAAVAAAIDALPILGRRLGQMAGTLSGGEQQMLALARAYAAEPTSVLLDEVSMGLAPRVVDEIFEFLKQLTAERRSLLIVEQYVQRALRVADLVYVLSRGRVVFAGEPAELTDQALLERYLGSGDARIERSTGRRSGSQSTSSRSAS